MKTITLLSVAALLLMEVVGPKSSVGGSMNFALILFAIMLAVAIHEAWANKRDGLGWIVNIVVSIIGGLFAVALIGMAMEAILPALQFEGSLVSSQHPLKYAMVVAIAILMVLGSWLPLQVANRFRSTPAR